MQNELSVFLHNNDADHKRTNQLFKLKTNKHIFVD